MLSSRPCLPKTRFKWWRPSVWWRPSICAPIALAVGISRTNVIWRATDDQSCTDHCTRWFNHWSQSIACNASSVSFISEWLVHSLCLPRSSQDICVSGIGGMSYKPLLQSSLNLNSHPTLWKRRLMSPPLWSQRSTVIFQWVLSRFRWIGNTSQISL